MNAEAPRNAESHGPTEPTPRGWGRRLLLRVGIVAGVLLVLLAVLPYLAAWTPLRNVLLSRLSSGANIRVSSQWASFGWSSPLSIDGLHLTTRDGQPLAQVASVHSDRCWWRLLLSRPDLGRFDVDRPQVELVFDEATTNFAQVVAGKNRPADKIPTFEAEVTGASLVARERGAQEPVIELRDMDLLVRIERFDGGRELVVEPVRLLDHQPLTREMCDAGLQLIVPVLADANWIEGDVSLAVDTCRVPIGGEEAARVEGSLDLHAVETGIKNPLLLKITGLVSLVLRRQLPTRVRLADESKVSFRVEDRRVWHEGLAFGLPEVSPDLVIRTRGWVGLDKSLDLTVEIPLPVDRLSDAPWASRIGDRPLTLHVAGTLEKPTVDLPADDNTLGQLIGPLLDEAGGGDVPPVADAIRGILGRVSGSDEGDDAAPPLDLGPLLERIRQRQREGGGLLRRGDGGEVDDADAEEPTERRLLRGLLDRIRSDEQEDEPGGAGNP